MAAGIPAIVSLLEKEFRKTKESHRKNAEIQLEIHQRNHQTIMAEKDSCIAMLKHSLSTVESSKMEEQANIEFRSRFIDEFEKQKLLGIGGYGCVFQARNRLDKCDYAVKRIPVQNGKEQVLREIRVMALLDHPGIVRFNNSWIECPPEDWQDDREMLKNSHLKLPNMNYKPNTNFVYMQMQLCDYSLADWLSQNELSSTRSLTRLKSWFKQIVAAVNYIHGRDLIHRDLKPGNILIMEKDPEAVMKVCDMGIVPTNQNWNKTIGSTMYMAPEQLHNTSYDSKADVFALGLILVELCSTMETSERSKIFDNLRNGKQCDLIHDETTGKFISSLTQVDARIRPSCKEILEDSFLVEGQDSLTELANDIHDKNIIRH